MPTPIRTPLVVAALAVLLAGCASGGTVTTTPLDPGGSPESSPGGSSPVPTATASATESAPGHVPAELTVTVDDGAGATTTHTLSCQPPGGDLLDPPAACEAVAAAAPEVFHPPPADLQCTMIYGGPQTATVTGTVGGEPVAATFARTNGCEIGRWEQLAPLLGGGVDS